MGFFSKLFEIGKKSKYRADVLMILDNYYTQNLFFGQNKINKSQLNAFYDFAIERLITEKKNIDPMPNQFLLAFYITGLTIDELIENDMIDNRLYWLLSSSFMKMDTRIHKEVMKYIDEDNKNDDITDTELYLIDFCETVINKKYKLISNQSKI
ncbi:MAG: hypothetical protein ACQERD_08270 [Campylobacterota bacterium]